MQPTLTLKEAIEHSKLTYSQVGKSIGKSKTTIVRFVNDGVWPARLPVWDTKRYIAQLLEEQGVDPAQVVWPAAKSGTKKEKDSPYLTAPVEEVDAMQLDAAVLKHFGLRKDPFLNDVETDEDVFRHPGFDAVREAVAETIEQRGFLAVSSPSGAGKTTVWDDIEAEYGLRTDTVICRPRVMNKEKLTPDHLCRALLYGLNGDTYRVSHESETRGRQLAAALKAIRTGGQDKKVVLLVDDAHFCTTSVMRQLKTFYEEKGGRFRLLAIILVGLEELENKLASFPEVGERTRLVKVPPVPVKEYLELKLRRMSKKADDLFDAGGWEAFTGRFKASARHAAVGYPLRINTTCIRAMVTLHRNGPAPGEKISRAIVDTLPGATAIRR